MRIAVAKIRPSVGQVEGNIDRHLALTELALRSEAKLVVFPELSLTGYEPARARELARFARDGCFAKLQSVCDHHGVSVSAGVPLRTSGLPRIASILFRPNDEPLVYSKMYLHQDEQPFFTPGVDSPTLIHASPPIAMAICFEISVPDHARRAHEAGAMAYVASVAKTARGVETASQRLSEVAAEYRMPVLMANCVGLLDGVECTGRSSVWDRDGALLGRLDEASEGVIVVDVEYPVECHVECHDQSHDRRRFVSASTL